MDGDKADGWSEWQTFPDPRKREELTAPIGPGCYRVRDKSTGQFILFGVGKNVAHRLTSLLPWPEGIGARKNKAKREYVRKNLGKVEYQTIAFRTRKQAAACEKKLRENKADYKFPT